MECIVADDFPAGGRYIGLAALFDDCSPSSLAAYGAIGPEVDEFFSVTEDTVVVRGRYVGRTAVTDATFDIPFTHLWRAKDGRLTWLQQYIDTAVMRDAIVGHIKQDA